MIYSIYPTDSIATRQEIINNAIQNNIDEFFTSLHLNEANDLIDFLNFLEINYKKYNFKYHADISPKIFDILDININELNELKKYGIVGLRLDYGFSTDEIKLIVLHNFIISFNASTFTNNELKLLKNIDFIAWHNFYPREETGLNAKFLVKQNEIFIKSKRQIYAFIPGDINLRMPLYNKLPTIEMHRYTNNYINYLELKLIYNIDKVVLAEGLLTNQDLKMILEYEKTKVISIPIEYIEKEFENVILDKTFQIRIEENDFSYRLNDTRNIAPCNKYSTEDRKKGDIQIDTDKYKRYEGEIHIIKSDCCKNDKTYKIGNIKCEYLDLVNLLFDSPYIKFIILD